MKHRLKVISLFAASILIAGLVFAGQSADDPLGKLMGGNERFVGGQFSKRQSGDDFRKELAKGQHPYAVVVACSDSRVAPEIVFDQDLGQVFVVRTAGNIVDPIAIGSIEYAVEHLHAPLIVVLGHESCGAVKATVEHKGKPEGNIGAIIKKIMPAVKKARALGKKGADLVHLSMIENVKNVAAEITKKSEIVSKEIHEGKVKIAGAYYSISTGKVEAVALR